VTSHRFARRAGGFALLEIALVIFVLSVAAACAAPVLQNARRDARAAAAANDLRVFSRAFQTYAREHGDWPDGPTSAGEIPPGMERLLAGTNWPRPTPLGGRYAWSPNSPHRGERYRAVIVITTARGESVTRDRRDLAALERKLGADKSRTGNFRLGYRDEPVFILEP